MTLRCECGGPVRVQDGTDPAMSQDSFWELYECETCGRTGTYRHDKHTGDEFTGCLVATGGKP